MSIVLDLVKAGHIVVKDQNAAIDSAFDLLIASVREKLAKNDVSGADELLAEAFDIHKELKALTP